MLRYLLDMDVNIFVVNNNNELHWKLNVGLAEDAYLVTRGYANQNLATLRKIVLKLLERETTSKHGITMKRLQAALSTKYLRKVVGF